MRPTEVNWDANSYRSEAATGAATGFRAGAVLPPPLYATELLFSISHPPPFCKDILQFFKHTVVMALIFIRTAVIFVTLLLCMRLMGKSQIGEMQPFEFVITMLIAELACIPMADSSIPLMYGVISVVTIFILHQLVWLLDALFKPMKAVICGRPALVITREGIDAVQLKKNNLEVSDLVESMRAAGYFNLDDVYYGLYESNGSFSALPREERTASLPLLIIDSGKADGDNMAKAGITRGQLKQFLAERGMRESGVLAMTADGGGRVYLQKRGRPYTIEHIEVNGQW